MRLTRESKLSAASSTAPLHAALSSEAATWQDRAHALLRHEIQFIPSRSFEALAAQRGTREQPLASFQVSERLPAELPAHLGRLCQAELLSAEDELKLFREMNYLKFRANAVRTQLNPRRPNPKLIVQAERWLAEARAIRDHLVQANMRLVISIVKKFVKPTCSFDEMLSDGIMSLLQAVEKFDFSRGYRFSTYAYRAISRNAYRTVMNRQKRMRRTSNLGSDDYREPMAEGSAAEQTDEHWNRLHQSLGKLIEKLDQREQFIIRGRFALGSHHKIQTFQRLANELGVSKERVRQLEQRALLKMQQMARDLQMDDLLDLALGTA